MLINTKYFGEFSYEKDDIIKFKNGLFGFEDEKDFILIHFDNDNNTLICLQSTNTSNLAFVVVNPFLISPSYQPVLSNEDMNAIEADDNTSLSFYSICVVYDNVKDTTVNLRCPIVVNTQNNIARQIILEDSRYSFKHPFVEPNEKGDSIC